MKRAILFAMALIFTIVFSIPGYAEEPVFGTYINKANSKEYLTLKADMTFFLKQENKPFDPAHPYAELMGTYVMNGETIKLLLSDGGEASGKIVDGIFDDGSGNPWVKHGYTPKVKEVGPPKRTK